MVTIPHEGLLRIDQICGNPKRKIPALIPVSRASWWIGVKSGIYPQPVKLGPNMTAWRAKDVRDLIEYGTPKAGPSNARFIPRVKAAREREAA